jgi:gluconate 2-dehydrogenase gamma chain
MSETLARQTLYHAWPDFTCAAGQGERGSNPDIRRHDHRYASFMSSFRRRDLLRGTALVLAGHTVARAGLIAGSLPWRPGAGAPPFDRPGAPEPGTWQFFTATEAAALEAIADRVIPPDPQTAGGKDAGCVVFVDRQLAGPYGKDEGLYTSAPFTKGVKQQGPQSALAPAELYRKGLAALDAHVRANRGAQGFAALGAEQQDQLLHDLEDGKVQLEGLDAQTFFEQLLKDVQQGFFADPLYGGNREMTSWKMIGFPGARYDYRDWVSRHNEPYPLPPVSIAGRADWTPKKG